MSIRRAQFQLATHATMAGIVEAAMMHAAGQILQEDESTPNHGNRKALAVTMYSPEAENRNDYLRIMQWRVAMNPTIQSKVINATTGAIDQTKIADNDVDYVVASEWDVVSNADLMS